MDDVAESGNGAEGRHENGTSVGSSQESSEVAILHALDRLEVTQKSYQLRYLSYALSRTA